MASDSDETDCSISSTDFDNIMSSESILAAALTDIDTTFASDHDPLLLSPLRPLSGTAAPFLGTPTAHSPWNTIQPQSIDEPHMHTDGTQPTITPGTACTNTRTASSRLSWVKPQTAVVASDYPLAGDEPSHFNVSNEEDYDFVAAAEAAGDIPLEIQGNECSTSERESTAASVSLLTASTGGTSTVTTSEWLLNLYQLLLDMGPQERHLTDVVCPQVARSRILLCNLGFADGHRRIHDYADRLGDMTDWTVWPVPMAPRVRSMFITRTVANWFKCDYCRRHATICYFTNPDTLPPKCRQCVLANVPCSNASVSSGVTSQFPITTNRGVLATTLRYVAGQLETATPDKALQDLTVDMLYSVWSLPM
ncbi:uncharacterized protein EV420DRAFT_1474914 [Desarmillaria tabescens]|uniref:Uncharacterized protein n=1 Tax=Armillaria tabescens TaxID=1929756 RepID=A0AA39NI78_ARMTA|nr:uncharacterized protein EV420DRAFT_1474914 [Desarmillaria tabescens]KAK0466116.1 hypothetical protein EV420DRAFT_1474914 [Desarmillaria tabescens]